MKNKYVVLQIILLSAAILVFIFFNMYAMAVTDSEGPEITIEEDNLQISVNDPSSVLLKGVTAYDEQDGDVTDSILIESVGGIREDHTVVVTYAAFDESGNVTKAQRDICYTDYISPRFTFDHSMTFIEKSTSDIMEYVGAVDVLEGDITHRVRATLVSDTGSLKNSGLHEVQLRVTNSLGDTAELLVPVEVYSSDRYNADLKLKDYILYLPVGAEFDPSDYVSTFTYAGKTEDLTDGIPEDFYLKYDNQVQVYDPGTYIVSYTLSHSLRDSVYVGHCILIVVVQ